MAKMYYADGTYKDTNEYGSSASDVYYNPRAYSPTRARRKSSNEGLKWFALIALVIVAIGCLVAVNHNLFVGKHANARNWGNEIKYAENTTAKALSDFTVDDLAAENGLQSLIDSAKISARHEYTNNRGEWIIAFFNEEWIPHSPEVVLLGDSNSHEIKGYKIERSKTPAVTDFKNEPNEAHDIELTLGKHTFVLTHTEAQTLIDLIRANFS